MSLVLILKKKVKGVRIFFHSFFSFECQEENARILKTKKVITKCLRRRVSELCFCFCFCLRALTTKRNRTEIRKRDRNTHKIEREKDEITHKAHSTTNAKEWVVFCFWRKFKKQPQLQHKPKFNQQQHRYQGVSGCLKLLKLLLFCVFGANSKKKIPQYHNESLHQQRVIHQ